MWRYGESMDGICCDENSCIRTIPDHHSTEVTATSESVSVGLEAGGYT